MSADPDCAKSSQPAHATFPSQAEIPFILTTGGQKSDPATRKLIRSHVMLGKNKGKPRPSKRRKQQPWDTVPPWDSVEGMSSIHDHIAAIPRRVGSDWSFTQLADEIEPAALADILKCGSLSSLRLEIGTGRLTFCVPSFLCVKAGHCPTRSLHYLPQE